MNSLCAFETQKSKVRKKLFSQILQKSVSCRFLYFNFNLQVLSQFQRLDIIFYSEHQVRILSISASKQVNLHALFRIDLIGL
ncbi:unnamed protein product [Oikopleura dioica]|uniref:Uncharacterized protein n=1 Tax=Oikopleura dioica TaxID=34765 RepID=E4YZR0_OIKDI|nr:unnamed protein product [Oikopleura dioica]